jgi:hypothetical protein
MSVSVNAYQLDALGHQLPPANHDISQSINNVIYVSDKTVLHWQIQRGPGNAFQGFILNPLAGAFTGFNRWNELAVNHEELFQDSSTWVLWDCIAKSSQAPAKQETGRAVVIVASSPDEKKHYNEFRHNKETSITMALWNEDEIESAALSLYRVYPFADVQRRFARFGPIARLVFTTTNKEIDIEQGEKAAVKNSNLGKWMDEIQTGSSDTEPNVSHCLIGRMVSPKMISSTTAAATEDPSMKDDVCTVFLNPTVEQSVMEQLEREEAGRVVRWLRESGDIPTSAARRGWVFEEMMHNVFSTLPWPKAGPGNSNPRSFQVQWMGRGRLNLTQNPLTPLSTDELTHKQRTHLRQSEVYPNYPVTVKNNLGVNSYDVNLNLTLSASLAPIPMSSYTKPLSRTFAIIDAFVKPRFLFQYTVSVGSTHTVKPGLKTILSALKLDGSPGQGDLFTTAPLLFFVVPQKRWDKFSVPASSWKLIPTHVQVFKLKSNDFNDNNLESECITEANAVWAKAAAAGSPTAPLTSVTSSPSPLLLPAGTSSSARGGRGGRASGGSKRAASSSFSAPSKKMKKGK